MLSSKTKLTNAAIAVRSAALASISKELLGQFVTGPMTGEAVDAASIALKKALIERFPGVKRYTRRVTARPRDRVTAG